MHQLLLWIRLYPESLLLSLALTLSASEVWCCTIPRFGAPFRSPCLPNSLPDSTY